MNIFYPKFIDICEDFLLSTTSSSARNEKLFCFFRRADDGVRVAEGGVRVAEGELASFLLFLK